MPYVTSVERIGLEKGMAKGLEQGLEQGRQQEGLLFLRRLLERKFGRLPTEVEDRLASASLADFEAWGERLLEVDSLEAVFAGDNGSEV